jgi:hypothetical protein
MSDNSERYPIDRQRYFNCVGRLLPHRLGQIFKELGYQSSIAKGQSNGVDLIVTDGNKQILAAEIINFSVYSSLSNYRKNRIIQNLSEYSCKRLLIYSCIEDEGILKDLGIQGISALKIGYQLQPKYFYDFFEAKGQVTLREVDSRKTRQDIKAKIADFLQSVGVDDSHLLG